MLYLALLGLGAAIGLPIAVIGAGLGQGKAADYSEVFGDIVERARIVGAVLAARLPDQLEGLGRGAQRPDIVAGTVSGRVLLAVRSRECRLTIFRITKLRGCGEVSSETGLASTTGSTGTGTYAISSLSAFVKVSSEEPAAIVVCSGAVSTFGVGIGCPALIPTIRPSPIEQGTASQTVLITSNSARPIMRTDCKRRAESGA